MLKVYNFTLMRKTLLYHTHVKLNAKMVPYAGFLMPLQYQGVQIEHLTVRNHLGVFDVSHMGEFIVEGQQARQFLQFVCSNDINKLYKGRAQYNFMPNGQSGVVDDMIVYQLEDSKYLLVVNAANIEKDWNWLDKHKRRFEVKLTDRSVQTSLLAIQGPKALKAMQNLTSVDLSSMKFYHHKSAMFAGINDVLIATTGYTGSGGIEIYFEAKYSTTIWKNILDAGKAYEIQPIGLAARDTLRIEMGFCLYGQELSETISPISSGLGWVAKPETKCIDHQFLTHQKANPPRKKLVGFILKNRGIPRQGNIVIDSEGNSIGHITSGTFSPVLKKGIALGFVDRGIEIGQLVNMKIRNKIIEAEVVKPPFIKR